MKPKKFTRGEMLPVWSDEMTRYLKIKIEKAGGQAAFVKKYGFHHSEISEMLRGKREVTANVAAALGYEKRIVFVRPNPWGFHDDEK